MGNVELYLHVSKSRKGKTSLDAFIFPLHFDQSLLPTNAPPRARMYVSSINEKSSVRIFSHQQFMSINYLFLAVKSRAAECRDVSSVQSLHKRLLPFPFPL